MSDTKTKRKPGDASIMDYYHKLSPYLAIINAGQASGATFDMVDNWKDMVIDNTLGADKYFHCKANCEATKRGEMGERTSTIWSDVREYYQTHIQRPCDSIESSNEDQAANKYGRDNAHKGSSCSEVCQKYRVRGINKKY